MSDSFSSFPELSLLTPEESLWFAVNVAYFFPFGDEAFLSFLFPFEVETTTFGIIHLGRLQQS
jgi:hypothetical protein